MAARSTLLAICITGILAILTHSGATQAQEPPAFPPVPILLGNTQERGLESAIVGDTYRLSVALPLSYFTATGRTYPVLYVLDPHLSFGTVTDVVRVAAIGGELPELIVVGVG
jgi:enterochelin esterase-like enzyme